MLLPLGLGLAILDGHLSIVSEPLQYGLGVLLGLWSLRLGVAAHPVSPDILRNVLPAVGTLVLAATCLIATEPSFRPLAPVLCWVAGLFLRNPPIRIKEESVLLAALVTVAINLVISLVPPIWTLLLHLLGASTGWFTRVLGSFVQIGPSALPMSSVVLVLANVLLSQWPSRLVLWRKVSRVVGITLGVIAAQCVALSLLTWSSSLQVETGWALTAVMNLLGTLGILSYGSVLLQKQTITHEEVRRPRRGASVLAGVVAGIIIATALWHMPVTIQAGKVLILTPPAELDPLRAYRAIPSEPQPLHELGMFGEWARFVSHLGYSVKTHVGIPTADDLVDVRVVCVFAPSATWASQPAGLKALQEFVERGGSLLVFAEHTNYQTNALVLNHLLLPFGIHINFDTTNGGMGEDRRGVRFWQSEFRSVLRMLAAFPYNRGASLSLAGAARPVLVGRVWQGDAGNFWADDQGFLGDYRLGPGDRWGDVILAAEWRGAAGGRVLVFGDTTPIMNASLGYTGSAVAPILRILMTPAQGFAWGWGSVVGILVVLALLWVAKQRSAILVQAALITIAGLAVITGGFEPRQSSFALPDDARTFIVATNFVNQIDLSVYGARAPTALMIEATRAGLIPLAITLDRLPTDRPTVVLLLAPRRTLSTHELASLQAWVEAGTTVIVAADGSVAPARAFLGQVGLMVGYVPLGNILLDDPAGLLVQLQSAWPLQLSGDWRPLRQYRGSVVIAERRLGQGRLVVISDEGIAMNTSLATERTVSPSNLAWWHVFLSEANSGS